MVVNPAEVVAAEPVIVPSAEPFDEWIAVEVERLQGFERGVYDHMLAAGNSPAVALANALASSGRGAEPWLTRAVRAELDGKHHEAFDTHMDGSSGPANPAAAHSAVLVAATTKRT